MAQLVETLPAMWETQLVPGLGRSPGEGNVNPLQYSCLENFMDRGAWKATVHKDCQESDRTEQLTLSLSGVFGKKTTEVMCFSQYIILGDT